MSCKNSCDSEFILSPAKSWELPNLYKLTRINNLLSVVFYDSETFRMSGFIKLMESCSARVITKGSRYLGYIWFTGAKANAAEIHFCFFPGFTSEMYKQAGIFILDSLKLHRETKSEEPYFIYGLIPEFNRKAIRFGEKLGFTKTGILPNFVQSMRQNLVLLCREL